MNTQDIGYTCYSIHGKDKISEPGITYPKKSILVLWVTKIIRDKVSHPLPRTNNPSHADVGKKVTRHRSLGGPETQQQAQHFARAYVAVSHW